MVVEGFHGGVECCCVGSGDDGDRFLVAAAVPEGFEEGGQVFGPGGVVDDVDAVGAAAEVLAMLGIAASAPPCGLKGKSGESSSRYLLREGMVRKPFSRDFV
ncbi:hypothetical protein QA942_27390 [Streptomyces sp. B21-106]|uniref:hypothetical protein n=1 Tax=Streptomyces sp. B21-106 TaxID=3039418 RepID=UPI002FF13BEC